MIPMELFMAGDILFYAIVLGKEGFATWWCNWCQLFKTKGKQQIIKLVFLEKWSH
jgi:hypothetical protein